MAKQTRYLFYDTELSGCEQIVSIGYILTDAEGNTLDEDYYIVKPYKKISKSTIAIHGITTSQAKKEGITLRRAMARFINATKACSAMIGYAPQNDILALSIGCRHLKRDVFFNDGESIIVDVARMAAKYMLERGEIQPGQTPSLEHAHELLTSGAEFTAHNALDDAKATAKCFFALKKMGYLDFDAIIPYFKVKHLTLGRPHRAETPHPDRQDLPVCEDQQPVVAEPTAVVEVSDNTIVETSDPAEKVDTVKKKKKRTTHRRKKKTSTQQKAEK